MGRLRSGIQIKLITHVCYRLRVEAQTLGGPRYLHVRASACLGWFFLFDFCWDSNDL